MTMLSIAANDLKTRGIAAIEAGLASHSEATISVRGKERFVVMPLEQYNFFRECELELALLQTKADISAGRYRIQSAQEHQAEIEAELAHEKNN
jgi:PHD/YefM family antitoxin component YafN of YafNO toxin-antitoxin module